MANNTLILGGLAASGSLFTAEGVAFGSFTGTNFEADSIIANADARIDYITFLVNNDAARVADSFATGSYNGAIYDYVLLDAGVGCRTGQFFVTQDDGNMHFTDTSTKDVGGDSTIPSISASFNGDNVDVSIVNGSGYTFKALVKRL
jgi:hypothetical protein